jgi:5-methylthioadenosine/S-adenosylhomocysteine deaminase
MSEPAIIIENGVVVTCDAHRSAGPMALLVRNGRIGEIAQRGETLRARYPFAEVIDASSRVIVPGFVDAHFHGESFVLRHWTTGVPYGDWTRHPKTKQILSHVQRELSAERLGIFYRLAYFAALRAGITFINEYGINNLDLPFQAALEGFRRSDVQGMISVHNGDQYDRARSATGTDVRFVIALPNEEDLTTYNMQTALRTARELKWSLAVHAGEARHGLDVFQRNFQNSLVQVLKDYHFLDNRIQLIHFSHVDEGEAALLRGTGASVICSPLAAMAKQSIVPPLGVLLANNVPVALGSDWGSPDPFSTMRSMLSLARTQGVRTLGAFDLIAMHTINAARAIGLESERGSLEVGKRADLAFVDVSDFRLSYMDNPLVLEDMLLSLLLDAGSSSVTDVMVGGEFFLRGGHIMTYAEEDLRREGAELMRSLARAAAEPIAGGAAPVYPLSPVPSNEAESESSHDNIDKGFRVVRRRDEPSPTPDPKPVPKKDPPRPTRRVFGEDDL